MQISGDPNLISQNLEVFSYDPKSNIYIYIYEIVRVAYSNTNIICQNSRSPTKPDGEDDRGGLLRAIFSKLQSNRVQASTNLWHSWLTKGSVFNGGLINKHGILLYLLNKIEDLSGDMSSR